MGAVECAFALQRGFAERNVSVPENDRINVRIGMNLGEVIVEGGDFYGEGVNIAARLEQMAEPGGVYVSGKVANLGKIDEAGSETKKALELDPSWTAEKWRATTFVNDKVLDRQAGDLIRRDCQRDSSG